MNTKTRMLFVSLFALCALSSAQAQEQPPQGTAQLPVPGQPSVDNQGIRNYLLGPGDVLDVRVFGQPDMNAVVEVDGQGNITSLPFLEAPIRAQCRSERDIQKDITTAYSKYIRDPKVSVRVQERKSRAPATVYGAVRDPARVQMQRRVHLHELLAVSGGITERASGTIQIVHTESEMCPEPGEAPQPGAAPSAVDAQLEVYKISDLRMGKPEADPFIRPGDVVIVTEALPIYVTGAVHNPQGIYMSENLTLSRALGMVGGPTHFAKTSEVHIQRQKDGGTGEEDIKVNFAAIRKGQEKDFPLKPYDIIYVPEVGVFSGPKLLDIVTGVPRTLATGGATKVIY